MSGASVTGYCEVYLSEFSSEEILEAALDIVKEHHRRAKSQSKYDQEKWKELDPAIEELARELGIAVNTLADDEHLPPASTAARIQSIEELRAWQARQKEPENV